MKGNKIFAGRIKKLREERGESQEDLAKLLGYRKQAISQWENSGKIPRARALEFIAEHYQTTSDYLLGIGSGKEMTQSQGSAISAEEMILLKRYRKMGKQQKDTIQKVAETIAPFEGEEGT